MPYRTYIRFTGALAILLGGLVILGWTFDIPALKSVLPHYNTMKINSAICILTSGVILLGHLKDSSNRLYLWLILFITLLSAASFSQDMFGFNLGIDELIFRDYDAREGAPGRMSTTTALSFMLIGISFFLLRSDSFKKYGQYACHLVTLISFTALLGYFFKVPTLYKLSFLSSMAVHTSVALFMLSVAMALLNPTSGLAGTFTGNKIGNQMARNMFPRMLVILVLISFFRLESHRFNLISVEFGIALFAISFLLVGLGLIWNTARKLNVIDRQRAVAEEEIKNHNRNLENLVSERTRDLQASLSKLQESELTLRRNQVLIKGIIDNAGSAIFVKDQAGRYILANNEFTESFGLSPENIMLKTAHDLFPRQLADQLVSDEERIFQSATATTQQTQASLPSGEIVTMLTNKFPLLDEDNHVYAIGVVATDITEQKKIEANLKAIFDSALVSIIETSPEGVITHFNRGAELLLGYQRDEMVGKHTPALVHLNEEVVARGKELSAEFNRKISGFDVFVEFARQGKHESREWTYVRKDGTRFPVQLVVTAIRGEGNVIHGFLGIATDITQQKEQQAIIEKQNSDLELLNKTKDKFFSIVAHDLKSPLNSLKAFSGLLADHAEHLSKEEIADMGKQLHSSVTNAIKMADNLITWARIQMNDVVYAPEAINVKDIIANVCDVYKDVARNKGISVACSMEDSLSIIGDKNQLEFVIRNLVNNAIKFTPKEGTVSLLGKSINDSDVEISISDSGVGMPKEVVANLFSIGSKQSTTGTGGEKGTGLGLMLSYEFLKKNGGKISVESAEGKGTTFRVALKRTTTIGAF